MKIQYSSTTILTHPFWILASENYKQVIVTMDNFE